MKNLKSSMLKVNGIILFAVIIFLSNSAYSQGAAINASGANADASAMLDVSSADKGMLIPRIGLTSTTVSNPVTTPATGLMVFNTSTANDVTPGFYYWNGTKWEPMGGGSSDADLRRIKTYIYTNAGGH